MPPYIFIKAAVLPYFRIIRTVPRYCFPQIQYFPVIGTVQISKMHTSQFIDYKFCFIHPAVFFNAGCYFPATRHFCRETGNKLYFLFSHPCLIPACRLPGHSSKGSQMSHRSQNPIIKQCQTRIFLLAKLLLISQSSPLCRCTYSQIHVISTTLLHTFPDLFHILWQQISGIMHFSPAPHQHSLKNEYGMFHITEYFPNLLYMLQHQFKGIRFTFTSISFTIINRPQNHIFFIMYKKLRMSLILFRAVSSSGILRYL